MITSVRIGLGACAAALALALSFNVASAQLAKEPAKKAEPVAKKAAPAAKKAAKPKSVCAGIDEQACGANEACTWVKAGKTKAGKAIKAYCRTKPKAKAPAKAAAPKAPAKAEAPKAPAKAKAPAPAPKN